MRIYRSRFLSVLLAFVLVGTGVVIGYSQAQDPGAAVRREFSALRGAKRAKIVTETAAKSTTSTSYVNLESTSVTTPGAGTFHIVARFSGESYCDATSWCTLRILLNGVEMNPVSGTDFAFDSADDLWESNSIDRTSEVLNPGTYTVTVQYAVVGSGTFRLDDYQLTVEVWKI